MNSKSNDKYKVLIKTAIKESLFGNEKTLWEIVRHCKGAYPILVKECLEELDLAVSGTLQNYYSVSQKTLEPPLIDLENNPILSSWYFTNNTCNKIADLVDWKNSNIAFLGTPKLFKWFSIKKIGKKRLLIDLDEQLLKVLSKKTKNSDILIKHDLKESLLTKNLGYYDYVILDPPWYFDEYVTWIDRALELNKEGNIMFSLFPELTRPLAIKQRSSLLDLIRERSRNTILLTGFLEYEIPTFEAAQLKAQGLENPENWKLADLVITDSLKSATYLKGNPKTKNIKTTEIDFGQLRFFIKHTTKNSKRSEILLSPISSDSSFLSTPSKRNKQLQIANVLTSRGHGLITNNPNELKSKLILLKDKLLQMDLDLALERANFDKKSYTILKNILEEK